MFQTCQLQTGEQISIFTPSHTKSGADRRMRQLLVSVAVQSTASQLPASNTVLNAVSEIQCFVQ